MATIDLGRIKFKWQGAYNGATAYVVDDVVESGGSAYVCIAATTGNTPPNASYWELMASKGTDTSVLTTQGDVLYHDGSSLARLSAGTSGQVLQTGGTGANPSWGTVSSDWVRLGTATASNSATVSFDGVFTSDYDVYKIFFHDLRSQSGGIDAYIKYIYSGGTASSNYSYHVNQEGYSDGGINSSGYTGSYPTGTASFIRMNGDGILATENYHATGHVEIFNPLGGIAWTAVKGYTTYFTSSKCLHCNFFGRRQDTSALTGIEFSGGGNFNGKVHLYGMKNS